MAYIERVMLVNVFVLDTNNLFHSKPFSRVFFIFFFYQVRAAYPVPHNETDEEVAIDMQYEQHMSRLHQAVNPADVVLGWLASMHAMQRLLHHHDMVCFVRHSENNAL